MDEIEMRKQSVVQDIKATGLKPLSNNYSISKQRTQGGCFIKSLDIPTSLIPGNFGCRVVDNMMPTNLSVVYKDRRSTLLQNFVCENTSLKVPQPLKQPENTDYLTDEESDEGAGFALKIPQLEDLISEFEFGDDAIAAREESDKALEQEMKSRGLEKEPRADIVLTKTVKYEMLDANIEAQRKMGAANLPGKLSEINSTIQNVSNKIYLR